MAIKRTKKMPPKQQVQKIREYLSRLAINVTAEDRSLAVTAFDITKGTLSKYLNGNPTNNDLAIELIKFLKERIDAREQKIAAICTPLNNV